MKIHTLWGVLVVENFLDRGRKERSSQECEPNLQSNFTLLTLTRAASPTVFSLQAHSSYANSFVLLPASLSEGECTTETLYPPGWLAVSVELRGTETSRIWCADTGERFRGVDTSTQAGLPPRAPLSRSIWLCPWPEGHGPNQWRAVRHQTTKELSVNC